MTHRRILLNSLVALIAVVLTSGLAAVAVVGGLPRKPASGVVDTGFDAQASTRTDIGGVTPTLAPLDTAPVPATVTSTGPIVAGPTAAAPIPAVTAPSAPEPTVPSSPLTPPPTWGPDSFGPAPLPPPPAAPTRPPAPVVDPSSWSLVENGITINASIHPARPRVGDTVTISYSAAAEGDFCCWSHVAVDGAVVDEHLFPPGDGCPRASEGSWTTTVVVTAPGPFEFQVQANNWETLCAGPPVYFNANLHATFEVLPTA